jgi:CRISPR/Cas system-associated endoribonuclease Cas2
MATFIITYDTHAGRNYQELYDAMEKHKGVRLAESVWGIELNNTAGEVRDWVKNVLDEDDTIVIIQVKPKPSWATRNATKEASGWLKDNI